MLFLTLAACCSVEHCRLNVVFGFGRLLQQPAASSLGSYNGVVMV
jgi:hypothetical protein